MSDLVARLNDALDGRYAIERELGEGGMATVYLAKDLRHNRKVALKVLKPDLAALVGAERFLAEIETTANLQHPHILPLFDSGEVDGFLFYVMPYVAGESLRDRLEREKQLPVDEALRLATAVANALHVAHEKGVIHRDIKPANILLSGSEPLIADFGIALAVDEAGGGRLTETGFSLGTPDYMSPEQAMGDRRLTPRSDVYSLGCVVYEMLVGDPPHLAGSAQAVVAKILSEKPAPIRAIRDTVPEHVEAAVLTALAKTPADRFASAAQFAEALANPAFTSRVSAGPTAETGERHGGTRRSAAIGWTVAAMTAALALWGWLRPGRHAAELVIRYSTPLPWGTTTSRFYSQLALTPDGRRLVYVGSGQRLDDGQILELEDRSLWVRPRDQLHGTMIPGTSDAWSPFISPDGTRVGYLHSSTNSLRVVSLDGGPPTTVVEGVGRGGASWGTDGYIYTNMADRSTGLARVAETGGEPEPLTTLDTVAGEVGHMWPDALPNARGVLFTVMDDGGLAESEIAVLDLESGNQRVLAQGVGARYARSGHVVFVSPEGTLIAAPFDQDALELTGEPTPIAEGVSIGFRSLDLALSATGTLLYTTARGNSGGVGGLFWVSRDGSAEEIDPGWAGRFIAPAISPDGTRLAVGIEQDGVQHVWIKQLDRGPLAQLSLAGTFNYWPAWTPDGTAVSFVSVRGDNRNVYSRHADGGTPTQLLHAGNPVINEVAYSPDGEWLVLRTGSGSTGRGRDLYALRAGTDELVPLVVTDFDEASPAVSPDGQWLAYVSNRSGRFQVYVRPFPQTGAMRWQVSVDGGAEPVWAHSGRELFYKSGGNLMSVAVLPDSSFSLGERRVLFPTAPWYGGEYFAHPLYDVTPDDQRFIMVRDQDPPVGEMIVVENFFVELRRLAPN